MDSKTYTGSCHCGKVKFEVSFALEGAGACNCSICRRAGWIVKSVPVKDFKLLSGEGAETDYQFGRKTAHHPFCATCGIRTHAVWGEGAEQKAMVNLRCLDGVDADTLSVTKYDGASY